MRTNYLLFVFLLLVFSCTKDSPSRDVPDNNPVAETPDDDTSSNNTTAVKLSLEGITELDFGSMEVVSINNVTTLSQEGEFDISEEENQDDFPFLFIKNEELLFGYYRNPNGSEITNQDILFYYFSTFPAITIRGVNDDLMAEILFSSQHLPNLEKEMITSLNMEQFPFENDKFNEVFALVAQEMFAAHDISNKSKDVVGEFSIDYSRDGMITWPTDVPLFATIGVEIIENASGNVVQSSFLQPKSLDVVRGLYDLVNGNNEEYVYFYQLLENGSYSINFNNGNPNFYDNAVTAENRKILVSKALNFAFLGLLKTFKNLNSECAESVTKVFDDALVNVVNQKLFATLSGPEAISVFKELVISMVYNFADIVGNCISSRFLTSIAYAAIKALTFGLEISEILFYFRDFSFSNIYGTQTRYFQDGISVGTLNETITSSTDFIGKTGDVFSYTANYEELKQSYEVDRSAIESKFILNEEFVPAIELPFNYEFIGDVNIETSNPLETYSDGDLEIFFTVGEQDSEIAIVPDFYYPVDLTKFVNVTVAEDPDQALSDWLVRGNGVRNFSLNNIIVESNCINTVSVNGVVISTDYSCGPWFNGSLTFYEDGTMDMLGESNFDSMQKTYSITGNNITINATGTSTYPNSDNTGTITNTSTYEWTGQKSPDEDYIILFYNVTDTSDQTGSAVTGWSAYVVMN